MQKRSILDNPHAERSMSVSEAPDYTIHIRAQEITNSIRCLSSIDRRLTQYRLTQSSPLSPSVAVPRDYEGETEDWPSEQSRDRNQAMCIYKDVHLKDKRWKQVRIREHRRPVLPA